VLSDSEEEGAAPRKPITMPKITDSDHEGEENDDVVENRVDEGEKEAENGEKDVTRDVSGLVESDDDGEPIREG
jgi:hypothetical protein